MIHVLQHYTPNFKPLIDITRPVHEAYCNKHGYQLHLKEVPEYPVYNGLEKLNQILEVCKEGDVALVMDADSCVTNLSIEIESFLSENKSFYLCEGLNMGIFIIKLTDYSKMLIEYMIMKILCCDYNCEQDVINALMVGVVFQLNNIVRGEISVKSHPAFNSYLSQYYSEVLQPVTKEQGEWEHGCFILHVPALPIEKRIEILTNIKEQIVYE